MGNKYKLFYRYTIGSYYVDDFKYSNLTLQTYKVEKETPCGYWLVNVEYFIGWRKWIRKKAKRSYAYSTKEEALEDCRHRNKKRINILAEQMETALVGRDLLGKIDIGKDNKLVEKYLGEYSKLKFDPFVIKKM